MTRVIHTGDTHIGYQQYHSPVRRQDFLDAFEQVISDAIDEDLDAVVHAGDLFHDRRPELQDLLGTISILRELDDAGIPFLAIVGNHESTRGGQWLDLFENLGLATRLGSEPVVVDDVAFYGLDHVPRSQRDSLDYEFTPVAETDTTADHAALVAHGLFEPFAHATWDTETVLREATIDFDAVLLGDNHVADQATVRDTWVTYCGSTERTSASETDGRSYNVVVFENDDRTDEPEDASSSVDIRQRALDTRPFEFISVALHEGEGIDRVRERIREYDLEEAVAVIEITGDGEPVTQAAVEEFATEQGALVARVTDRREIEADADVSVTFADPDDAVRERIDEMGLSSVALDVDETIRASKVADSNVRDEVRNRVEDAIDDPDRFDRAPQPKTEDDAVVDTAVPSSAQATGEASPDQSAGESSLDQDAAEDPSDQAAGEESPEHPESEADEQPGVNTPAEKDESNADGQVSMEDFL